MLVGVVEEGDDLLLLARIERPRVDLAAGGLDIRNQGRQLVAVAAAGENRKAFGRELLRSRRRCNPRRRSRRPPCFSSAWWSPACVIA
jgi:hypothetical protein